MNWLQIIFSCNPEQSEMLEDALLSLGALSITYQDAEDQPVLEPGVGEMPLWANIKFSALFTADIDTDMLLIQLAAQLPFGLPEHRIEIVEKKDWERAWMDHYHTMRFGKRLWICPSWQAPVEPEAVNLMLDPGLAFGTGTHPTTALCLQWLDAAELQGKTVVDFGCGSGVLGIAALLLGAKQVIAVDNDPQALLATRENARRNGCEERFRVCLPGNYQPVRVDVVLANILAKPLIELAPILKASLKPGGQLVMSGLLREQADLVMAAYRPVMDFFDPVEQDGWMRLEGCAKHS
jgi:ribosomal protein L11 methyltransferase